MAQEAKEELLKKYINRIVELKEDSEGSNQSSSDSEEEIIRIEEKDEEDDAPVEKPAKRVSRQNSEELKIRLSTRRLSSLNFEELGKQFTEQK